jgi:hypothetical protein
MARSLALPSSSTSPRPIEQRGRHACTEERHSFGAQQTMVPLLNSLEGRGCSGKIRGHDTYPPQPSKEVFNSSLTVLFDSRLKTDHIGFFRISRYGFPGRSSRRTEACHGDMYHPVAESPRSSANASGSFTPPTNSPLPDSRLSC